MGWPREAATWSHALDIEDAGSLLSEFRRALLKSLPHEEWVKLTWPDYSVPVQYEVKTKYEKRKEIQRYDLDQLEEKIRRKEKSIIVENEVDCGPPPKKFKFILDMAYHESSQLKPTIKFPCHDPKKCGFCAHKWYFEHDLEWPDRMNCAKHYKVDKQGRLLLAHSAEHVIIECTEHCECVQQGKCTNNGLMRLRNNPLQFGELKFCKRNTKQK